MAARQVEPETPPVETANAAVTEQPASEPVPADQPAPESVQAAKPSASAENISDPAPQPAPAPAPADQPAPAPADQPAPAPEVKADPVPEEEARPAPAEAQGTMGNDQHEGAAQADSQQHNLITMLNFPSPAAETDNPQEAGSADPANAVAEPSSVENMTEPAAAAETVPGQEETPPQTAPSYTEDMSVEEICQVMTMEEAGAIVVPRGPCMGWTMAQVAERRPSSLRFFLTKFCECSNSQKAAATLLMQDNELKKAGYPPGVAFAPGCGVPSPSEYQAERGLPGGIRRLSHLRRPPRQVCLVSTPKHLALLALWRAWRDAPPLWKSPWNQQFGGLPGVL